MITSMYDVTLNYFKEILTDEEKNKYSVWNWLIYSLDNYIYNEVGGGIAPDISEEISLHNNIYMVLY